jgi:hypothetical protein
MDHRSEQKFNSSFGRYSVKPFILVSLCVLLIFISVFFRTNHYSEKRIFVSPIPLQEYFSFGLQPVLADLLWLRAIQDMDYCEEWVAPNVCKNESWLYRMLDQIFTLAPDFRMPFAIGPLNLSVVLSDTGGASKLFDRAVQAHPRDWKILYRAGYHALFEENNKEKAADLLSKSARFGGPEWLYAAATSLWLDSGHQDAAQKIITEVQNNSELSPEIIKRIQEKLQKNSR